MADPIRGQQNKQKEENLKHPNEARKQTGWDKLKEKAPTVLEDIKGKAKGADETRRDKMAKRAKEKAQKAAEQREKQERKKQLQQEEKKAAKEKKSENIKMREQKKEQAKEQKKERKKNLEREQKNSKRRNRHRKEKTRQRKVQTRQRNLNFVILFWHLYSAFLLWAEVFCGKTLLYRFERCMRLQLRRLKLAMRIRFEQRRQA